MVLHAFIMGMKIVAIAVAVVSIAWSVVGFVMAAELEHTLVMSTLMLIMALPMMFVVPIMSLFGLIWAFALYAMAELLEVIIGIGEDVRAMRWRGEVSAEITPPRLKRDLWTD